MPVCQVKNMEVGKGKAMGPPGKAIVEIFDGEDVFFRLFRDRLAKSGLK